MRLLIRTPVALAVCAVVTPVALAHHGFGTFVMDEDIEVTGTVTGLSFVNPHSWLYLDVVNENGETVAMRCEMRSANTLRRSGWTPDLFPVGKEVTITGSPDRDDPYSCYVSTVIFDDGSSLDRYGQITAPAEIGQGERPLRLANGEPNISGDWAQEQYVIAVPPSGRGGNLVPKSMKAAVEAGEIAIEDVPPAGWGPRPVTLTERGQAEADAFRMWSTEDNPRLRCEPTSILFDWVFDGAVNRITQETDRIVIDYGLYSFERVIHMNMGAHPQGIEPSYAGHSIGRWEGDVLVVDTIGFLPGVLAPPVRHSDQLHVVERFSLSPETMELHREYVAEDPVYFVGEYVGADTVLVSDVPYVAHPCDELAPEFR
jgi:hypothetical protein